MRSFFTGVAVGFGVGLLLAPEAGSETRKKVMERFETAKDQVRKSAEPIIESVSEHIDQVEELVQEGMQQVQGDGRGGSILDEAARLLEVLNTASKTKLMGVTGIGDATARRIIDGRPYDSADGVLSEDVLRNLKKELLNTEKAA
jgi:gas vesicle protein